MTTTIDSSDEATGLPEMAVDDFVLLVVKGCDLGEGIASVPPQNPGELPADVVVRYVGIRGLTRWADSETAIAWGQTTIAVPVDMVPALVAALRGEL